MAVSNATPGRVAVREYIMELLSSQDTFETVMVCNDIIDGLTEDELRDLARPAVMRFIQAELAELVHRNRVIATETGGVTREGLNQRAKVFAARIFENVGGSTRMSLVSMTRPATAAALEQRERTVAGHMPWIRYHREILRLLPNDTVTVGDHFSEESYDALFKKHFENEPPEQLPGI